MFWLVFKVILAFLELLTLLKCKLKTIKVSIYDMKEKKKVTEDHLFRISEIEKGCVNSVFKLEKYRDEYIILFRLEKTLQGDRFDPIEAYQVSAF